MAAWTPEQGLVDSRRPQVTYGVRDEGGRGHVLVVTRPTGAAAAVSVSPAVDPGGSFVRSYLPVPLEGGVGTTSFDAVSLTGVAVRTTVDGRSEAAPLQGAFDHRPAAFDVNAEAFRVAAAAPSCAGLVTAPDIAQAVQPSVLAFGLGAADVTVTPAWCRSLGSARRQLRRGRGARRGRPAGPRASG